MYILSVIQKSFSLFSNTQKLSFSFLMIFFLLSALIQVIGIASIGPFIALLSDPEIAQSNKLFFLVYSFFDFTDINKFIMAVAVSSLSVMVFSNFISALTLWLLMRFSIAIGGDIQIKLFENLLHRDYLFHKSNNYSDSIALINQEAPRFVYMVMQPILLFFSNLFIAIIILIGLIFLNPLIAILTGIALGLTYLITYMLLKRSLKRHGEIVSERNSKGQKILSESFVGIKEVKLNKLQKYFLSQFEHINSKGLNSTSFITLSGDIPKFAIETVAFSVIFIAAIIKLMYESDVKSIVPVLSIYAIAGYKLLPTMQQIYKSISTISAHGSVPFVLSNELQTQCNIKSEQNSHADFHVDKIELRDVSFKYPSAKEITLSAINITFFEKKLNTIAGHSGSGKSTLVDILLGLLKPDQGIILVNDKKVDDAYLAELQQSSGYVPQQIFILDDSIVANIAFGVDQGDISEPDIVECLKKANAWEFVERLPSGIHTKLGQDGKLLSGGQRQKIGIARALYRKPKILILDEPTSALDIESEYDFMMLLGQLKSHVLIIVISHRPSAIKCSDLITIIDHGRVESSGSIEELRNTSPTFISMLEKSSFN